MTDHWKVCPVTIAIKKINGSASWIDYFPRTCFAKCDSFLWRTFAFTYFDGPEGEERNLLLLPLGLNCQGTTSLRLRLLTSFLEAFSGSNLLVFLRLVVLSIACTSSRRDTILDNVCWISSCPALIFRAQLSTKKYYVTREKKHFATIKINRVALHTRYYVLCIIINILHVLSVQMVLSTF